VRSRRIAAEELLAQVVDFYCEHFIAPTIRRDTGTQDAC
jgi:hypothetical protein